MLGLLIPIVMCLAALVGLALVAPSVIGSWRTVPIYYNLARLALPVITLVYLGPGLFGSNFPGRSLLSAGLFLGALALVLVAIVVYLYLEPAGPSHKPNPASVPLRPELPPHSLLIRTAQPPDLPQAGRIFAEAFSHSFDLDFGPDRERNGRLIGELLTVKKGEVEIAVWPDSGQVVGAMWLDLAEAGVSRMHFGQGWPILRRYLNPLHALYFAIFALPTIMERRGTSTRAYIQWLGVDPQWQGRHIARELLDRAVALSRAAHKQEIVLHTERSNSRARHLYAHYGFHERNRLPFGPRIKYVLFIENSQNEQVGNSHTP